jgi:thioredoxin type arsenate reductase
MTAGASRASEPTPAEDASPIRVIFVCTGNSARSQMAEALLRQEGGDRFEVVSAGVDPRGVHPMTIDALARVGIDISGARSKSVGEFLGQRFDYVITVCDRARATCPVFPGGGETLHWGVEDPVEVEGTEAERRAAFDAALRELAARIRTFLSLALNRRAEPAGTGERPPRPI